jgi:aminopeptidase N
VGFNYGDFVDKSKSDDQLTVTAYSGREIPDVLKGVESALAIRDLAGGAGHNDSAAQYGIMTGGFNTTSQASFAAAQSYQAFKLFESVFGPLPFKNISVTEQPVLRYGQSWPTLIFLPFDSLLDSTTRHSLRLQESAEAIEFYNIVAIHEMSHQWWGHMVGWKTYHDQWLSEGFAEFSAAFYEKVFEPKKVQSFWDLKRRDLLSSNRGGKRPVDVGPLWLNYQTNSYLDPETSMLLRYYKGAYVLEMLGTMMEDPRSPTPNARFSAMMKDFVSTYAGKNASTEDFRRIVEKHWKERMDWFFDEWVYGTSVPHYDFSYQLKPAADRKTILHLSLTQSGVPESFQMRVPIYVYISGSPQRLGLAQIIGNTTANQEVALPVSPDRVAADPFHSILCSMKQ